MSGRSEGHLFVGRLSKSTRNRDLEDIFEAYGRLSRCEIKYGKFRTKKPPQIILILNNRSRRPCWIAECGSCFVFIHLTFAVRHKYDKHIRKGFLIVFSYTVVIWTVYIFRSRFKIGPRSNDKITCSSQQAEKLKCKHSI